MEIELYNCPHCNTKGVVKTQDNLCPNCKQTIESSDKVIQEVSVAVDVNANFNTKNWHEKSYAKISPMKTFGIVIICCGFLFLIISPIVLLSNPTDGGSFDIENTLNWALFLAIAGCILSWIGILYLTVSKIVKIIVGVIIFILSIPYICFLILINLLSHMPMGP